METKELLDLNSIVPSKKELPVIAAKITQAVEDGFDDAVSLSAKLDFISKVCDESRKLLKEQVMKEIEQGTSFAHGYKTELAESGVTYDYSNCNDEEYNGLMKLQDELKESIKARQDFLKGLPANGFEFVNPDTGELVTLHSPVRKSTSTARFTLQK